GVKMLAGMIDEVLEAVGVPDESAEPSVDRKGKPILDPAFSMTERIPLTEDVGEHMEREVLPFAPDVTWDEEDAKVGYEIPLKRWFGLTTAVRSQEEIDADVAAVMG